jgi:hypothetical protein
VDLFNLTDTYGDVPFSQASQLDESIMQPKFDRQKDIYLRLLDDLKAANSLSLPIKYLPEETCSIKLIQTQRNHQLEKIL